MHLLKRDGSIMQWYIAEDEVIVGNETFFLLFYIIWDNEKKFNISES